MERNEAYGVYNVTRDTWATSTNFSTREEAEQLLRTITAVCRDNYMVRAKAFGTLD